MLHFNAPVRPIVPQMRDLATIWESGTRCAIVGPAPTPISSHPIQVRVPALFTATPDPRFPTERTWLPSGHLGDQPAAASALRTRGAVSAVGRAAGGRVALGEGKQHVRWPPH